MSAGSHRDADPLESYGESEDCLYANVWVPKTDAKDLPVVVWIHGGGFMMRTGSFAGYWGDGFVTASGAAPAVLVTFNYRLAIFGFYSSADTGANFGFQDQQLLLRWVRDNIAAFGGDPSRVTLSGQSAGALSVVCHLAAPGSSGLFHRAVATSPVGLHYRRPEENAPFVRTVAKAVGCSRATNITRCLRSKSAFELKLADIGPEYIFHLKKPCDECDNILPWLPVVDGHTLPMSPVKAFQRGNFNQVPTIISTTRNETLAFVPTILREVGDTDLGYELVMKTLFQDRASEMKRHYSSAADTAGIKDKAILAGWISTDALMTCYSRYLAKLLSQYVPTFLSTFMLAPLSSEMDADNLCVRGPPSGATCHAGDIQFFLPQSSRMTQRTGVGYRTQDEKRLGTFYTAALINFSYDADTPFILYTNGSDVGTSWDIDGNGTTVNYHRDHCDFLESIGFVDKPWGSSRQTDEEQIVV
jgi:carboxylesterase type B